MMTAAFGEESATGSSIMSPSGGIILSQDSSEHIDSTDEGTQLLPAAEHSLEKSSTGRQSFESRRGSSSLKNVHNERHSSSQLSADGFASGLVSGTPPTVSWPAGCDATTTGEGEEAMEASTPDDRMGGLAGGESYQPVSSVTEPTINRRNWNLTAAIPGANNSSIDAGGGGRGGAGHQLGSPPPEESVGAGGWGLGMMPPRWVPDEENAACAGCGKDFDWARRRHHCRVCGRLYCYSCSRFRVLLPRSFGTRDPQRVCQPCHARVAPMQEMLVGSVSNSVRENDVSAGGLASYLNRPIAFTLGTEVRKAAYTVHNFTKEGMIQDRSIPQELLSRAKGLAFLTVIKGGFIVAGRLGTGLVVAKTFGGVWSAPSAIATVGLGWGALIGGEITDFVLVLNTDSAVEAFSGRGQVSVGAELSVAVGPVGRTGAGNVSVAAEGLAHAYSYSHSRGLFAGLSLEGGVIIARPDVNRKFYGREVSVRELLSGSIAPPPAARPLYEALEQKGSGSDSHPLLTQGFRMG